MDVPCCCEMVSKRTGARLTWITRCARFSLFSQLLPVRRGSPAFMRILASPSALESKRAAVVALSASTQESKRDAVMALSAPTPRELDKFLHTLPELNSMPTVVLQLVVQFCAPFACLDENGTPLKAAMTACIAAAAAEFQVDAWNAQSLLDSAQWSSAAARLKRRGPAADAKFTVSRDECQICLDQDREGFAASCGHFLCFDCGAVFARSFLETRQPVCAACPGVLPEAIVLRLLGDTGMARLREKRFARFCLSLASTEQARPSFVVRCPTAKCRRYVQERALLRCSSAGGSPEDSRMQVFDEEYDLAVEARGSSSASGVESKSAAASAGAGAAGEQQTAAAVFQRRPYAVLCDCGTEFCAVCTRQVRALFRLAPAESACVDVRCVAASRPGVPRGSTTDRHRRGSVRNPLMPAWSCRCYLSLVWLQIGRSRTARTPPAALPLRAEPSPT